MRIGAGAAILPSNIQRIDLQFAQAYNDGHFGARKVWRNHLPRLKYYNPSVSMTVQRHNEAEGPSVLTVFFNEPTSSLHSGAAADQTYSEPIGRTQTIDMKHKLDIDILAHLMEITKAKPYEQTAAETAELEEQALERRKRDRDRERQLRINDRLKYETKLLQQARESTS